MRKLRHFSVYLIIVFVLTAYTWPAKCGQDSGHMVILVNRIRKKHHLPPLKVSRELTSSASSYARCMAENDFFGHKGRDGSTCETRNIRAGYNDWTIMAENIAAGYETPEEAVDAWMKSPSHRENIMSKELQEIGTGHAYQKNSYYGHYWVQEFGKRKINQKDNRNRRRDMAGT